MKTEIKKLSRAIFERLSIHMYGKIIEDRYLDHFDLIPEGIENSLLIMGINPSSTDLENQREPDPCFIHYIPDSVKLSSPEICTVTNTWNHGDNGKKFCYPQYFNRIYNIFDQVNFYPLFVSPEYNLSWEPFTKILLTRDKQVLRKIENKLIKNFIIVMDLIPIKETNSKLVVDIVLNNPDLLNDLNTLLELRVKCLNPKLTIIFLQKSQQYFENAIKDLKNPIIIYPFIKYLNKSKYQKIKSEIISKLGQEHQIYNKWSYIK